MGGTESDICPFFFIFCQKFPCWIWPGV